MDQNFYSHKNLNSRYVLFYLESEHDDESCDEPKIMLVISFHDIDCPNWICISTAIRDTRDNKYGYENRPFHVEGIWIHTPLPIEKRYLHFLSWEGGCDESPNGEHRHLT